MVENAAAWNVNVRSPTDDEYYAFDQLFGSLRDFKRRAEQFVEGGPDLEHRFRNLTKALEACRVWLHRPEVVSKVNADVQAVIGTMERIGDRHALQQLTAGGKARWAYVLHHEVSLLGRAGFSKNDAHRYLDHVSVEIDGREGGVPLASIPRDSQSLLGILERSFQFILESQSWMRLTEGSESARNSGRSAGAAQSAGTGKPIKPRHEKKRRKLIVLGLAIASVLCVTLIVTNCLYNNLVQWSVLLGSAALLVSTAKLGG